MKDVIFKQRGKDHYYKTWHAPQKNIFIFVESGEGSIVSREQSYPIAHGVLCFVGEKKYHYTFPNEPEDYVRSKLLFSSSVLDRLVRAMERYSEFSLMFHRDTVSVAILSEEDYERASKVFEHLNRLDEKTKYLDGEIYCAALELMIILAKSATAEGNTNFDSLQKVVNYINKHISEQMTIDEIGKACYISKYHLCRTFKRKTGLTIMDYILKTRIVMAAELLRMGNLSVTHISSVCGFSSPSYFSRVFKEEMGVSPIQYKKEERQKHT